MTENRRIVLNTAATYGRSVFAMALGMFSSRWVLGALGKEDYGLFGVVGSVMAFVTLLSGVMGGAVGRYYAFSIGEARKLGEAEGREHIMMWFNAALTVYTVLPIVSILIGYPIGLYAIHNWLVIPPERITASIWIFNLSMLTAFVGMVTLPYISMYRAYQYIAELSIWDIVRTMLTFSVAFSLFYIKCDRLLYYAVAMNVVMNLIPIIQSIRAWRSFGVCHFKREYFCRWDCIKKLCSFSFWEFFGCFGDAVRSNGTAFVINKYFGVTMNAAYSVSNTVAVHTTSLSNAMIGALTPAVTTAEGSGNRTRAINLAFCTCKFGAMLIMLFAIPLVIEMDEVLRLWLVTPPEHTATYCRCVLLALICHKLGWGHHMSVYATGRIAAYQLCLGTISISTIFLIWGLVASGLGAFGVGLSFILSYSMLTIARVLFARKLVGMSVRHWLAHVFIPVVATVAASLAIGSVISRTMEPSFLRVCAVSAGCLLVTFSFGYWLVCSPAERSRLTLAVKRIVGR